MDGGAVEAALRAAGVERATHVFHCAYLMRKDPGEECEASVMGLGAPAGQSEGV